MLGLSFSSSFADFSIAIFCLHAMEVVVFVYSLLSSLFHLQTWSVSSPCVFSLTLCSSLVSTKRKRYSFVAWFLERLPTVRDFCGKYCQQQLTSAACCSFRSPCLLRHQHDHDVCTSRTSGSFLRRVKHYFVHVTIMQ